MILYVGDLDERYGPDLLIKAMPAVLRHHQQARLVIVGDGQMLWPLRVYARYLLLEHAIRLVGHVTDQPMYELIQAADMIVVPSRESTPWWPILAGWAARRPVVATHDAARTLLEHEKDSVLVYPSENSIVWGIERVLYDAELAKTHRHGGANEAGRPLRLECPGRAGRGVAGLVRRDRSASEKRSGLVAGESSRDAFPCYSAHEMFPCRKAICC